MSVNAAWLLEVGPQMTGSVPSGRSAKVFSLRISGQHVKSSFLPWAKPLLGPAGTVWKEGTMCEWAKKAPRKTCGQEARSGPLEGFL